MKPYFKAGDWVRWTKRIENLQKELVSLSKGVQSRDIKQARQIAELAHFTGAIKYLTMAKRECESGYFANQLTEEITDEGE